MIKEQHIIKFEYTPYLYNRLDINNDFRIKSYTLSKKKLHVIYTDIYYNYLNIHTFIFLNNRFDYIFNISNMLYKLHTKDYYSKTYQNKELI